MDSLDVEFLGTEVVDGVLDTALYHFRLVLEEKTFYIARSFSAFVQLRADLSKLAEQSDILVPIPPLPMTGFQSLAPSFLLDSLAMDPEALALWLRQLGNSRFVRQTDLFLGFLSGPASSEGTTDQPGHDEPLDGDAPEDVVAQPVANALSDQERGLPENSRKSEDDDVTKTPAHASDPLQTQESDNAIDESLVVGEIDADVRHQDAVAESPMEPEPPGPAPIAFAAAASSLTAAAVKLKGSAMACAEWNVLDDHVYEPWLTTGR